MIDDKYIKKEFQTINGNINRYRVQRATKEELDYLNNRYNDSESLYETLIRIFKGYDTHPKCPICGKPLKLNRTNWRKYCSQSCKSKDLANNLFKKYGVRSTLQLKEIKEKTINTLQNHYGVDNPLKSNIIKEKIKQTCLEKYGVEHISQSKIFKEKVKQTCLEKYGAEYYLTSNDCKEKTIKKLGVDNYRKTEESKQLVSKYIKQHSKEIENKKKKTYIKNYGVDNPQKDTNIKLKTQQTCLEKYGVKTYSQTKEFKQFIQNNKNDIVEKINNTKRKNNSFHISNKETESYEILKEKYPDVTYQYKSELYPFMCDFYIPSLDLYIECNYHWTHGGHPFNENNIEDKNKLELWKSKNTEFYNNAINTWTVRDINKRNIAKENNLNFIEFWNINELKYFIQQIKEEI